ncbi:MAG: methyl-accepting chemotaxis protein, partial [Lachnospiraceae bacterium]|nr:methyl-accepting chemotaxis protein [Lachnospiraceae bacterium]
MRKLSLKGKLIFLVTCMIVYVTLFFCILGFRTYNSSKKYTEVINKYDTICYDIAEMNVYISRMQAMVVEMTGSSFTTAEYQSATSEFESIDKNLEEYKEALEKLITDSSLKEKYDTLLANMAKEKTYAMQISEKLQNSERIGATSIYKNSYAELTETDDVLIDEISAKSKELASKKMEEASHANLVTQYATAGFLVFFIISGVIISGAVIVDIRRPLQSLVGDIQKLASGEVEIHVEKHNNDEIGQVADAVNLLAEKNRHTADMVESMSGGDFSIDIIPATENDVLGHSLKRLIDGNNATLSEIREAAAKVGSESEQVAMASQSLAQGSTEQASAIEEVTASIADITERTKVNAENAKEAST